jgi:type IV pilus assembly protein PilB
LFPSEGVTRLNLKAITEFNKKLFKVFKARGIAVGAIPGLDKRLISDHLVETGKADPILINSILEELTGVQSLDPTNVSFDNTFLSHITLLVPEAVAREEMVFPVKQENEFVFLVMAVPQADDTVKRLESVTGSRIKQYCCNGPAINRAIDIYYRDRPQVREPFEEDADSLVDASLTALNHLKTAQAATKTIICDPHLIRMLQHVMNALVDNGASDLHFEPGEHRFRVRYRKDGIMQTAWSWPPTFKESVIPRIKLIARMDLDQTALPQDGSINFGLIKNRMIDFRVSSLPSLYGEKIVMRILERDKEQLLLTDLGMEPGDAALFNDTVHAATGLILVTGPTGSGKSTTLYAVLNELNTDSVNIVTAEDPVEYTLDGLTQVNCSSETGLTFSEALRSFLRQDPDIIMVGEIRDAITADIALKSAMTGHLVLSTLHTNDAPGAINRLINMGIPPYLVASARILVVAQRLLRRLCTECRVPNTPDPEKLKILGRDFDADICYEAAGCPACHHTGYNGRLGIYELLPITDQMIDLILKNQPASVLKAAAIQEGMVTLRTAAIKKMAHGLTTFEEVVRVTMES